MSEWGLNQNKKNVTPTVEIVNDFKIEKTLNETNNSNDLVIYNPVVVKMVPKLLSELSNGVAINDFGNKTSTDVSNIADQILKSATVSQMDTLTMPMSNLLTYCKTLNMGEKKSALAKIPLIKYFYNNAVTTIAKTKTYFVTVEKQLNELQNEVEKQVPQIKQAIQTLERMFVENENSYYILEAHIQALEKHAEIFNKKLILDLEQVNKNDRMQTQQLQDRKSYLDTVARKVNSLKQIRITCEKTAPSIRTQQLIGQYAIEKFTEIKFLLIPEIKKQCGQFILSLGQKKSIDMINKISDFGDEVMRKTSESVNENAIEAQKSLNKGLIKVETLQEITDKMVETLEELENMKKQGRQDLIDNSKKYLEMSNKIQEQANKNLF